MPEIESLIGDLTSGEDERAEQAAIQLADSPEACLPYLQALLQADTVDQRWWAVRTLAQMPTSRQIIEMLVAALQDPSAEVRQCAALAFASHPQPEAIAPLVNALQATDSMLISLVANALVTIGNEAVPALLNAINEVQPAARIEIIRALAEIGDHRAIPALMSAMQSDSAVSQFWAEYGLNKLGLGMVYLKPS